MPIASSQVVIQKTATLLVTAPGNANKTTAIFISGLGVYLGGVFVGAAGVTPTTGFNYLQYGASFTIPGGDSLYGVSLTEPIPVSVLAISEG